MSRGLRLQLERVNLLAMLVVLSSLVLCALGQVDGDTALAFMAGVAVKGHNDPST